jgi:hypothetical protein
MQSTTTTTTNLNSMHLQEYKSAQMRNIFCNNIIPLLLRNDRVAELLLLRQVNSVFNEMITRTMATLMSNTLNQPITWPMAKLLTILKSPTQLRQAQGELFFKGKEFIAAELVQQWLRGDFLRDLSGDLFTWHPESALWVKMEKANECVFRSVLKILICDNGIVTDQPHLKALNDFFKHYDGSSKFKAQFKELCQVQPQLSRPSHKIPIKRNLILDLKERKIRPRLRNDFCCVTLPIEIETAELALQSLCIDDLLAKEKKTGKSASLVALLSEAFEIFLNQLTCNNVHLKYHLQRMIGRFFAGDINAKKILCFLHGGSNSAKSTFGDILLNAFVDHMKLMTEKALFGNSNAVHDSELLDCAGFASLLYLDECKEKYTLMRALINRLLGASVVKGRAACSPTMQQVELKKHLLLSVNHLPQDIDSDTLAKCQIIPILCQFVQRDLDVNPANHQYKADDSFKEKFLADDNNRQGVYLFVLIGALDYWRQPDAIYNNVPEIVTQAANVRFGKQDATKTRLYSPAVTKFAINHLHLDQDPDLDDFTPTETLYEEFKRQNMSSNVSSREFGKTLKLTLGAKYHCENPRWNHNRESGHRKQVRGFLVNIKRDIDAETNDATKSAFPEIHLSQVKRQKVDNDNINEIALSFHLDIEEQQDQQPNQILHQDHDAIQSNPKTKII